MKFTLMVERLESDIKLEDKIYPVMFNHKSEFVIGTVKVSLLSGCYFGEFSLCGKEIKRLGLKGSNLYPSIGFCEERRLLTEIGLCTGKNIDPFIEYITI